MKEIIDTASNNPEIIGGTVFGGVGIWMLIKKLLVRSAIESTNLSAADGYGEIIDSLREEVRRLGEANSKLATTLNQIQFENIELKTEVARMRQLIARMEQKISDSEV